MDIALRCVLSHMRTLAFDTQTNQPCNPRDSIFCEFMKKSADKNFITSETLFPKLLQQLLMDTSRLLYSTRQWHLKKKKLKHSLRYHIQVFNRTDSVDLTVFTYHLIMSTTLAMVFLSFFFFYQETFGNNS